MYVSRSTAKTKDKCNHVRAGQKNTGPEGGLFRNYVFLFGSALGAVFFFERLGLVGAMYCKSWDAVTN